MTAKTVFSKLTVLCDYFRRRGRVYSVTTVMLSQRGPFELDYLKLSKPLELFASNTSNVPTSQKEATTQLSQQSVFSIIFHEKIENFERNRAKNFQSENTVFFETVYFAGDHQ